MIDYMHYLPVSLFLSLLLKRSLFGWAWLAISMAMLAETMVQHMPMLSFLWRLDLENLSIQTYFIGALAISYAFGALFTFKTIKKTEALSAYFYTYFAFHLLQAATWTDFIMHLELMSIFSAILIFCRGTYQSQRAALMSLLYLVLGASCLIAGSLMVHDNVLSHFQWSFELPSILILLGLMIHAALFPFHDWFVRAHENASTQANFFLHALTPLVAIYGLILLFSGHPWLIYMGIASSVFSAIYLLMQFNLRKIIAFQALVQLGLIVLCIGLGSPLALKASLLSCLSFAFFMPLFLNVCNRLQLDQHTSQLNTLQTQDKKIPLYHAMTLLFAGLCATGLPFLSLGFLSETMMHEALNIAFSWSFYFIAFMQMTLFYTLVLKPLSLCDKNLKKDTKTWTLDHSVLCVFIFLTISFGIKSSLYAFHLSSANGQFAVYFTALFLGCLPVFYTFKKHLTMYHSSTFKDLYEFIYLPNINKQSPSPEKIIYPNPRKRTPIKLFYFETIENSLTYILTVFFIVVALFFLI